MRRLIFPLAAAMLVVSACGSDAASEEAESLVVTPALYSVPENAEYNVRWSADPGIDLLTPEVTVIRAYVESYYLSVRALTPAAGYPGFSEAVDEHLLTDYGNADQLKKSHYVGTQFQHLLWMTPTERGWFATVCTGDYSVMREGQDGRFFNVGSTNIGAETVEIVAPGSRSSSQSSEGPERAPVANVFGGWKVIDHVLSARNQAAFLECRSRMPDAASNRPAKWDLPHDAPYPTLAPYPGWPSYDEN
ncbi:MAG: hypothetical protein AAGC80_22125, partial [Rhodococcus sp. (in: high G+C Gram-positive bacteria)]